MAYLYFLDIGNSLSSWKSWQKKCFEIARRYSRQLFTKSQIMDLYRIVKDQAMDMKGYTPGAVTPPDFDFCDRYDYDPSISVGAGCSLPFRRINGWFDDHIQDNADEA